MPLYLKGFVLFPKAIKEMDAETQVLLVKSLPHAGLEPCFFAPLQAEKW